MGKRGPKPGEGGRPIQYNDLYHVVQRAVVRQSRTRQKIRQGYASAKRRVLND